MASIIQANKTDANATLKWNCISRITITNTTNVNDETQKLNIKLNAIADVNAPDNVYTRTTKGMPIKVGPYFGQTWFVRNWADNHAYTTTYDTSAFNPNNETILDWKSGITFMMLDEPYNISELIMANDVANVPFTVTVTMGTVLYDPVWWNKWETEKLGQTSGYYQNFLGKYVYHYFAGVTYLYEAPDITKFPIAVGNYDFGYSSFCPFVVWT